jgi:toxin-antitoxin system PIN domain toxin
MRALLDVNVLIALLDPDHSLHRAATQWFADHATAGWASCPITENGCVRIMSHPNYPNALPAADVAKRLREACDDPIHAFWPDDVSLLDGAAVDSTRILGPRQITDVYLLALASKHGGRFVTFDHAVSIGAVPSAQKKNLLVL